MLSNVWLPSAASTSPLCRDIVEVKLGKRESNAATATEASKAYKVRVGLSVHELFTKM